MKNLFLFVLCFSLLSCNNDDEVANAHVLDGKWNLVEVSCECLPVNLDKGQHIWRFNVNENKLLVENNVNENLHTILDSGTYTIDVTNDIVKLQDIEYDYYFNEGVLYLDHQSESDGPLIKLLRD